MKLAIALLFSPLSAVVAFTPIQPLAKKITLSSSKADLEAIATKANPIINYYDPLGLADREFWNQSNDATIGFLRHSEIKHGRVAMAAFVGYCVQSSFTFPWPQTLAGDLHPSASLSPEAQWDATPFAAKLQILFVIGLLEFWDETGGGLEHYMRGRQPGKYPTFDEFTSKVHPVLNLYDPFGANKKMSDEQREKRLVMEINNGRLAMLGIFSLISADVVPGSVPALAGVARPYDGDIMAPFGADFSFDESTLIGSVSTLGALLVINFGSRRNKEIFEAANAPATSTVAVDESPSLSSSPPDLSIPYDAVARLAFEASDNSVEYETFKVEYETSAASEAAAKWQKMFAS